jgi:predicted protein tyrosine phosphatase
MTINEDFIPMNRMAVIDNPYQGNAKRVLCVCSAGVLRSPTLAAYLNRAYGWNTRAVGVDSAYALIPISRALVAWAHEIWCVNDEVYTDVLNYIFEDLNLPLTDRFVSISPKYCIKRLDLPDQFAYNAPELLDEIKYQISVNKLV